MTEFKNLYLNGISHIEPDRLISSDDIEKDLNVVYEGLKLPFGRIEMQTGIKSRGVFENKLPSDIGTLAAKKLFTEYNIDKNSIDLLIHASVCRDMLEPSTASFVHNNLELSAKCMSFDLSNACLGAVSSIVTAGKMIESGAIKNALIVTGENSKPLLDNTIKTLKEGDFSRKEIKKYFANFTIGSAGVALLISGSKENAIAKFSSSVSLSNTKVSHLCKGGGDMNSLVMETNSPELMQEGIILAKAVMDKIHSESADHYIPHQVGVMHRDFLYKELGLDLEKDHTTFDRYGNTGSAALPLTLSDAKGKFNAGDKLMFLGIGSGLHATMMELQWI